MTSPLIALRRNAHQPSPMRFLAWHAGCWIQYYDDTPAKAPGKALSARTFDLDTARGKQRERCAVCFSLQAFGTSRTKEGLLCFRNLGVDVDLVAGRERGALNEDEIDRRKDEYLRRRLLPFPLKLHWLTETRHGFHVIFRVEPQREESGIRTAMTLNGRLVRALGGDTNAALLTQVLRVPGTIQFKDPRRPFLCRLLLDNAARLAPYPLDTVRSTLDAWDVFHGAGGQQAPEHTEPDVGEGKRPHQWGEGLSGVPEGRRNAMAAVVIGGILGRLPQYLWETGGWGGLKEWNQRNAVPLPERELRSVFESIARRERGKRNEKGEGGGGESPASIFFRLDVRITGARTIEFHRSEVRGDLPDPSHTSPRAGHAQP